MSDANKSGPDASVKEGLGKLASPIPEADISDIPLPPATDSAATWSRVKKYGAWTILSLMFICLMIFGAVSRHFLQNATIRDIVWGIMSHPKAVFTPTGLDWTGYYNLNDHFPPDKRKAITVLVLGSDHDTTGRRDPGHTAVPVDVPNTPGRSDAIMIARFEFDGDAISAVNVLSIPRDTRVRVPGHGVHKINAAHAYGGPELSCATIRDVFGIDPDYYIDLNFEGFQQVVDAVGGVDINVHQQLDYDDNWGKLHVHLRPGPQHLDGYKAMGYVRIRHTDNDLMRAQRQHEFLEALRTRIVSRDTFLKLPAVVGSITNNLHSSLSMDQMLTLANLVRKAPKDAICLDTLPVIEGKTFVYIDRRKSAPVLGKMFFKDKRIADLNIKTPDTETVPVRHRRHRSRDNGAGSDTRPRGIPAQAPTGGGVTLDENGSPAATRATSPQPAPDNGEKSEKQDRPDNSAPSETPKSDSTTGSEGGKPPSKDKDGQGTSSGSTSRVLKG
jgi:LCP family protein required for cell wall assembly